MAQSNASGPGFDENEPRSDYPRYREFLPDRVFEAGHYLCRFARTPADLDRILRLRFAVFNLELNEGLNTSFETGRDEDRFDPCCHHLLVEDTSSGELVGTYRMQTSTMAAAGEGFYSDGEFDLETLPEAVRGSAIETGRACIHRDHRNRQVLFLLWQGLAAYVQASKQRYLFGCSSINSQDPRDGLKLAEQLAASGASRSDLRVEVRPAYRCDAPVKEIAGWPEVHVPRLFRTYLRYGSKVCSPPALDREFKSIDFLMLLDIEDLSERSRLIFFS